MQRYNAIEIACNWNAIEIEIQYNEICFLRKKLIALLFLIQSKTKQT